MVTDKVAVGKSSDHIILTKKSQITVLLQELKSYQRLIVGFLAIKSLVREQVRNNFKVEALSSSRPRSTR